MWFKCGKFLEHRNVHKTNAGNLTNNTDVIYSLEIEQEMIVHRSLSNHDQVYNQMATMKLAMVHIDVVRFGANLFVFGSADSQGTQTEGKKTLPIAQVPWLKEHLTRNFREARHTLVSQISTVWQFFSEFIQNITSMIKI